MDDAISKRSQLWDVINGFVIIPYSEDNNLSHDERNKIQLVSGYLCIHVWNILNEEDIYLNLCL